MTSDRAIEIRVMMKRKRVSQVRIARELEVTHAAVYNVIEGKSESMRVKRAIAKACGTTVEALWPKDDEDERAA